MRKSFGADLRCHLRCWTNIRWCRSFMIWHALFRISAAITHAEVS